MRKNIWANLQLLDFGAFCEQHSSTTVPVKSAAVVSAKEAPVNAGDDQYFSAISNNHSIAQKSMETVFWFLFHRLSPTEAQERFRGCYPVYDRQNQGREFRSQATKWLEQLKREGCLPQDLMIRKSYFDECRGERYERTLLALSDLVLKRVMEKTGLFTEELMSINERDGETKHQTAGRLEQMLSRSMEELRVFHEQRRAEEERWNRHAARVQQRYNGLLERKAQLELQKANLVDRKPKQVDPKRYQQLIDLWCRLDKRLNDPRLSWRQQALQSVLQTTACPSGTEQRVVIDGPSLIRQLHIGDRFAQTWSRVMQQHSIAPITRKDGRCKLDVMAVFRLWQIVTCAHLTQLGYCWPQGTVVDSTGSLLKQIEPVLRQFQPDKPPTAEYLRAQNASAKALLQRMEAALENLQGLTQSLTMELDRASQQPPPSLNIPTEKRPVRFQLAPFNVPTISFRQPTVPRRTTRLSSQFSAGRASDVSSRRVSDLASSHQMSPPSSPSLWETPVRRLPPRISSAEFSRPAAADMTELKSRLKELRERRLSINPNLNTPIVSRESRDDENSPVASYSAFSHFCDQIANHAVGGTGKQQDIHAVRNPLEALNLNTTFQTRSRLKNTPPPAATAAKTPLRVLRQAAVNSEHPSPQLISFIAADQSMMDLGSLEASQMLEDVDITLI